MNGSITIAVDAMGGDRAPAMVLQGADLALERDPAARFLLFGDETRIAAWTNATPHALTFPIQPPRVRGVDFLGTTLPELPVGATGKLQRIGLAKKLGLA